MSERDDKEGAEGAGGAKPNNDAGVSPEAQAEIEKLKKDLDAERDARVAAERAAADARKTATTAAAQAEDAELQMVSTAIDTVETSQRELKSRYSAALSSQDYDAAADIQAEMSENAAKLLSLKSGKAAMEEERKRPVEERRGAQQVAPSVEEFAQRLTPKSAEWVRKHPQYVQNPRLNRKMIRAHEDAMDDGMAPDSPEYFEYVETRLGVRKTPIATGNGDGGEEALSGAAKGKGGRGSQEDPPPPSIPANGGGGRSQPIRLTAAQKEMAHSMGMTEEEYAKNLQDLKAEGRIH